MSKAKPKPTDDRLDKLTLALLWAIATPGSTIDANNAAYPFAEDKAKKLMAIADKFKLPKE